MKQTDRPITAIKVNNPEIRDIINKLSEPIHRERFSNPLQFRRTCSTNEFRFNGARCGNGALKKRERENRNREKKGVKGATHLHLPARTRNNVHYALLTRFLPPRVFFRGRKMPRGRKGGRQVCHSIPSQSRDRCPTTPTLWAASTRCRKSFSKKGGRGEKEISDFRGVGQSDFLNPFPSVTGMLLPRLDCLAGRDRKFTARAKKRAK